jgi:hypothetical protein
MAFEKAFKTDKDLVTHFESFINALFNGEAACELLNPKTTKKQFLKFFAGTEYESFEDFERSLKSHTKRANKKEKLDEFIKSHNLEMYPHSSYSIFLHDMKKKYEEKHSDMSPKDLRALMTKEWSKMSDKAKQPFEASYTKQKDEFIEKVREIDEEYVGLFDKSKAPKAPPRPYTLFVTEQMKEIRKEQPDVSNKDVMKLAGQAWREMTDAKKKKYYEKCGVEMPTGHSTKKSTGTKVSHVSEAEETGAETEDEVKAVKGKGKVTVTETKPKTTTTTKTSEGKTSSPKAKAKTATATTTTTVTKKKVVASESETSDVETPKPKGKAPAKPSTVVKKSKTMDDVLDDTDHTESEVDSRA